MLMRAKRTWRAVEWIGENKLEAAWWACWGASIAILGWLASFFGG